MFNTVGKRGVRCNLVCEKNGDFTEGGLTIHPASLGLNLDRDSYAVIYCRAKGAPMQDDRKTPRVCENANLEINLR